MASYLVVHGAFWPSFQNGADALIQPGWKVGKLESGRDLMIGAPEELSASLLAEIGR